MIYSLNRTTSVQKKNGQSLNELDRLSVRYHNLFDFPLTFAELIKWQPSKHLLSKKDEDSVIYQSGYYFLEDRRGLVYKRSLRERISAKKMEIAKKAAKILGFVPSVKMVAVTGSLAMGNSSDESDIDLMIMTRRGCLWTTRLLSYFVLSTLHYVLRRPFDRNQKDKLCLNMWMDESDLVWRRSDRNIYTAHEIAQILPLVNKDKTYEKLLFKNKWVLKFWPNSVKIRSRSELFNPKSEIRNNFQNSNFEYLNFVSSFVFRASNLIAYRIQYQHMKSRITREMVTKTRAIFHPQDWGKVVMKRLAS